MNSIYKVIWSKAKNCYVVASEIAKSHTKSASGQSVRRSALASLLALSFLCGGLGVAEASVHVNENTGGAYEVLTKQEVTEELNKKVSTEVADLKYGKASDVATNANNINTLNEKIEAEKNTRVEFDQALNEKIEGEMTARDAADQALNQKIEANKTAIDGLKAKDTELEGNIQANKDAIDATNKRTAGIDRIDATSETTIENNVKVDSLGNVTAQGQLTGKGVDAGTGDITTTGAVNAGSLKVENASNLKGDVTMDKKLSVTGDTTLKGTKVDGKLTVTDDAELKNTEVKGTLGVTGATTLSGELTAKENAKFEKNVTVEKDLTVDGKLNVGEIYLKNDKLESTGKKHDSATSITADGISNLAKVTEHGNTTESQFTHNEKGTFNHAKDGNTSDWKESTSNVTADGVENIAKDSKGNNNTFTQTSTDTKNTLTDTEGNTSSTRQDSKGIYGYAKDKDGNKSYTKQEGNRIAESVIGQDGKETKSEMTSTDITNTAKDGTIKNDAKDIVNNATGDMTNTVGGNQTNTIGGNQTTNVTGDILNTAKNITNEATEKLTDKVGDNTRVTTSTSITDTVGTANRKIEDGKITDTAGDSTVTTENGKGTTFTKTGSTAYSTAAGAPTDTNIAGNHITTGRVDANELGVSDKDGANTADLSVKAGEGVKASAGNGTTTGSLDVKADEVGSSVTDASGKGSTFKQRIDAIMGNVKTDAGESEVTQKGDEINSVVGKGEATNSRVTQKKGSLEAAVTDGTNTNVSYDTANASAKLLTDGTKVNKQQDNLDSSEKTITNGTYKTSTMQSALDITHTAKDGTITHDAKDIVNNASNSITDKVGDHTRVLDGEGITDTVGGSTFKQRIDKIMMESKDVSIKAEETLTNEAKVITNKASEVINNEAININNTATGIITSKASEIKNQADKLISNKVGENTSEYMEDGKITTSVKDGAKSTVTIQNADGLQAAVTNGTSTNASATTATSSAQTIASGSKANSVITTIDGTQFVNSDAWAPVTGASGAGTAVNTTIKGNTITTGKVTMDYADVMKDLGVHGSAKVDNNLEVGGTTTTKTLKVTEDADVGRDLVVGGNATIRGDVTANSYKVGDKTYISAAGINANDQKITNVADGSISEGSKDAVNGGQLYGVKRDLEHQVDKVGANAAAMANLRPMEFDPSSKWNIAAAIGNYGSETAAAIGAFYRPNDNVMVNLSTAFGTGENMVGGGVSVRLGKGGNKLSREETNALKAQVADLTARMNALLSVLNPNMSKDFPDVPENHWAYEAVSRLAGNDIVQGYPDGEFHGERTMTRYEMAEIIYNALSRGAEAERELVEEFKPELQAMAASEKATAEKAEG